MRKKAVLGAFFALIVLILCACAPKNTNDTNDTKKYRYDFTIDGKEYCYELVVKNSQPSSFTLYENGAKDREYALDEWSNGEIACVLCYTGSNDTCADIRFANGKLTLEYNSLSTELETKSDRIFSGYDHYAGDYATTAGFSDSQPYVLRENGTALVGDVEGTYLPWSGNTVLVEYGDKKEIITLSGVKIGDVTTGSSFSECNLCYYRGDYTGTPFIGSGDNYFGELRYADKTLFVKGDKAALIKIENDSRDDSSMEFGTLTKEGDAERFSGNDRAFVIDKEKKTFAEKPVNVYTAENDESRKLYVYSDYRLITQGDRVEDSFLIDDFSVDDRYYYTTFRGDAYTYVEAYDKNIQCACVYQAMSDAQFVGLGNVRAYVGDAPDSNATYTILSDDAGATTFNVANTELQLIGNATGTMYVRMPEGRYVVPAYYVYYYETDGDGNIKAAGTSRGVVRFMLRENGTCTVLNATEPN